MSYVIQSTEKNRGIGSEYETKALLYLMNFRTDSNDISYYIIDFFNDLTGSCNQVSKLWDIQSKASKDTNAKALGREMVTLFKNYLSNFNFLHYILFVGGVADSVRIDGMLNEFDITNVKPAAYKSIKTGLKEEALAKSYIDSKEVTDENIDSFLSIVRIVVDDKKKSEYVKAIIQTTVKFIPHDEILDSIFYEIKNKQSEKKNSKVEGIILTTTAEALYYDRHLKFDDIRLMAISRIINRNPLEKGAPSSFYKIIDHLPYHIREELILDGQIGVAKALSNRNNIQSFWKLFEEIYSKVLEYPHEGTKSIHQKLDKQLVSNCPEFDLIPLQYFISTIKDGIT